MEHSDKAQQNYETAVRSRRTNTQRVNGVCEGEEVWPLVLADASFGAPLVCEGRALEEDSDCGLLDTLEFALEVMGEKALLLVEIFRDGCMLIEGESVTAEDIGEEDWKSFTAFGMEEKGLGLGLPLGEFLLTD